MKKLSGRIAIVIIFVVSSLIINEVKAETRKENIEIIVNISDGYKKAWHKMVKNPKIKDILHRAKLYVLYEGDPMSEQVRQNSLAANSNLYFAGLGTTNGQFDLINLGYLAKDQSKHASKINEIKQKTFNYMHSKNNDEQSMMIKSSFDYNLRMWELLHGLIQQTKSADEFDKLFTTWTKYGEPQLIFVNGKFTPRFLDKYTSKTNNTHLGNKGAEIIGKLLNPTQGM